MKKIIISESLVKEENEDLSQYKIDDNYYLYKGDRKIHLSDSKEDLINFLKKYKPELISYFKLQDKKQANNKKRKATDVKILWVPMNQKVMKSKFPSFNFHLKSGILVKINPKIIQGLDPAPATWTDDEGNIRQFKKGGTIDENKPIEVKAEKHGNEYDFYLYDGNHRIKQALLNGDKYIRALVETDNYHDFMEKFS